MAIRPSVHQPYPRTTSFKDFVRTHNPKHDNPLVRIPAVSTFLGTIKLHGTNATIMFYDGNSHRPVYQSRNLIITQANDNQGSVALLDPARPRRLVEQIMTIRKSQGHSSTFNEIMIAGEIAGKGVHKGVAITNLDRFYAIFNIRIDGNWVDMREYVSVQLPDSRVFNIVNFPTWQYTVDFEDENSVQEFSSKADALTESIGASCPFASTFKDNLGKPTTGRGEGIVWTLVPSDVGGTIGSTLLNFKTKAPEFVTVQSTSSKPPADALSTERAEAFVAYALGQRRLEQGIERLLEGTDREADSIGKEEMKAFLTWVISDMLIEENQAMLDMGADERLVKKTGTIQARDWFLKHYG